MVLGNSEPRLDVESPDSGVDMNNFDFDIDGCNAMLLGVNDPVLNNFDSDISEDRSSQTEVINLELPVITSDSLEEYNDEISVMESDKDDDEGEENSTLNISKNHPVEIHSYSIMKIKKPDSMKSRSQNALIKDRLKSGRKYCVSLKKKPKLYEMAPLNDPVAEKNRLNALNAKMNRDRKKQQLQEAEEEIDRLKEENEELKTEADQVKDELAAAKRELEALRQELKLRGGENASFLDEREE